MTKKLIKVYLAIVAVIIVLVYAYHSNSHEGANSSTTYVEKGKDFETTLEKALKENPEIIINAIKSYHKKQEEAALVKSQIKLKEIFPKITSSSTLPKIGSSSPKATLINFFDYNCIYCKKMANIETKLIEENKDMEIIFVELPILGEGSAIATKAALAVWMFDKEKYHKFHIALLKNDKEKTIENVLSIAGSMGIDMSKLKTNMASEELNKLIEQNHKFARDIGIQGTPAYIIDGQLIPGMLGYEELNKLVKQAIESKK